MASEDVTPIITGDRDTHLNLHPSGHTLFSDKHFFKSCPPKLASYRKNQRFTDVIVKAKHVAFPCHKVVLSAACPFFEDLLLPTQKGQDQDIVPLSKTSPEILEMLIDFLYVGEFNITSQNVQAVITASDEMQLSSLRDACDHFLADQVQPSNCLGLLMYAKMHNLPFSVTVATECMNTRVKDILQFAPESEYKVLTKECLIDCISTDDLVVEKEDLVFSLAMKWIENDQSERDQYVGEVLEHVRLPLCTVDFLCDEVEKHPLMKHVDAMKFVSDARNYHLMPHRRHTMASKRTQKRKCSPYLVVMGSQQDDEARCLWYLDELENKWKDFTKVPGTNVQYSHACVVGNSVIVTGGRHPWKDKTTLTGDTWMFSVVEKKWKPLSPMSTPRFLHCLVSVRGTVYAIGGFGGNSYLRSVECLDIEKDCWIEKAPMSKAINHPLGTCYKEDIFILGGIESKDTLLYNTKKNKWYSKASLPESCDRGSVTVLKNHIYIVGDVNKVCMRYDPDLDTWNHCSRSPIDTLYPAATVWNEKILLGGGGYNKDDSATNQDRIDEYSPELDKWSRSAVSLPICMSGHVMFSIRGIAL